MKEQKNKESKLRIPKSFKLFSSTINVVCDTERMNDHELFGMSEYGAYKISLIDGLGSKKYSDDTIVDTFYHEKVHMILDAMHERDLSTNEKFVEILAKLLRQSDETAEY